MPRYKCKVDVVYPYEFEMNAITKEELINKLQSFDTSDLPEPEFYTEIADIEELPEVAALFTLPVLPENAPQDLKDAYKVFEKHINQAINNEDSEPVQTDKFDLNCNVKEKIRKQSDSTKITQKQYDLILEKYSDYKNGFILGVNNTTKFRSYLNKLLGLNKSRSVYSKIWSGGVNRESLPTG